jgi:hypothetical protein
MAPARTEKPVSWPTSTDPIVPKYDGPPRNIEAIDALSFDSSLQPKQYDIHCTHPESKVLFTDVNILDSTGKEPFRGDVLIEGKSIEWFLPLGVYDEGKQMINGEQENELQPWVRFRTSRN